jgi:hypothetical protein
MIIFFYGEQLWDHSNCVLTIERFEGPFMAVSGKFAKFPQWPISAETCLSACDIE